uniref:Uncharacterized protein n=1 Tax=Manihot esculenta TaxID=3983 RepID=A0A2C9UWE7_MANES
MAAETSTMEEQRRREERCNQYSSCYFCEKLVISILKCFGRDSESSSDEEAAHLIPSDEPPRGRKKPSQPPVSSGGGGKIN